MARDLTLSPMFTVLGEQNKVERRAARQRLREEQLQAKLSLSNDEVKGRAWADVSDDEDDKKDTLGFESSDDENLPDSPVRSPVNRERAPQVQAHGYPAAKEVLAAEPKQLSKKAQKVKKQQELDDLDSVLAEFGVGDEKDEKPTTAQGESKNAKKKRAKKEAATKAEGDDEATKAEGDDDDEVNGRTADPSPEPSTRSPEGCSAQTSDVDAADTAGMDDETKAVALEALRKKAAAKKGGKAKSATVAAAAEAKKRAANAAKPKRDKNAFDR